MPFPMRRWSGEGATIRWVGPERGAAGSSTGRRADATPGRTGGPGLVDCHTHLAFGGWRADEFAPRASSGASYLDIARAGGGIAPTVRQTREPLPRRSCGRARGFLGEMLALGVTTVEAKSGYGLDREHELELLRVYQRLAQAEPIARGGHLSGRARGAAGVSRPSRGVRRAAHRRADPGGGRRAAGDGAATCSSRSRPSAWTRPGGSCSPGARRGSPRSLHADQLSAGGGAELAAEVGALSADHLEHVSERGIAAMARAGVVAVSLPIARLYLSQPPMPARAADRRRRRRRGRHRLQPGHGAELPPAARADPGVHPPADDAGRGAQGRNLYAARALGLERRVGSLERGKAADFAVIDAPDVEHWLYHLRPNACRLTVAGGRVVWRAPGPLGRSRSLRESAVSGM